MLDLSLLNQKKPRVSDVSQFVPNFRLFGFQESVTPFLGIFLGLSI